jgi:hypothetical protein
MNEMPVTPAPDSITPEPPKKNNTAIIIGVVVVVLLCCCCITLGLAWQFGDAVVQSLGM